MEWIDLLEATTGAFAEVLETGDLDASVPACPGWSLADLGEHTRWVHAWAAHAAAEGNPDGATPPVGRERDVLVAGYRAAADRLLTVLRGIPADEPAWTFGPQRTSGFWRRRQVHEVTVHLHDALASQGREAAWSIAPDLAWDGVEEVASLFYPRQVRSGRSAPLGAPLRLVATDLPDSGLVLEEFAEGPPVDLSGTAEDLLLTLWGRRPATGAAAELLATAAVTP